MARRIHTLAPPPSKVFPYCPKNMSQLGPVLHRAWRVPLADMLRPEGTPPYVASSLDGAGGGASAFCCAFCWVLSGVSCAYVVPTAANRLATLTAIVNFKFISNSLTVAQDTEVTMSTVTCKVGNIALPMAGHAGIERCSSRPKFRPSR